MFPLNIWLTPPAAPRLRADDVHLWLADLDILDEHIDVWRATLNKVEHERAQRYVRERDRVRFVTARGILRWILAKYLHMEPQDVVFTLGPYGKPALDPAQHAMPLRFNLSHSEGFALFGFAYDREIGVDIQHEDAIADLERVATNFFSLREVAALRALPEHLHKRGFYACWSRKEAYIKATGLGLTQHLAGFDVSLDPTKPAALLGVAKNPDEVNRWRLQEIVTLPGFSAAISVEGQDWDLSFWDLHHILQSSAEEEG
jgi:4'-phosphopantetheinyl transferase